MSAKAEVEFSATDAGVLRLIQRQEQQFGKLDRKLDAVEKSSRKAAKSGGDGFAKFGEAVKGVGLSLVGGGSLLAGLELIQGANRKVIEQATEIAARYDEANRKWMVQTGLKGIENADAQLRIAQISIGNAQDVIGGQELATQLVSSGFSSEQASGDSLDAMQDVLASMNQSGHNVDKASLGKAMAGFLTANQLELNGANLRKYGGGLKNLFDGTNVQLDDLPALGKEAGALKSALSPQEQLAAAAVLKTQGSQDGSSSATNLRNVVGRLQTASASDTAGPALERLGLKPGDVDFVGERLEEVLGRLEKGFQSVPEEERAGIAKQLVSEAGIASLQTLMDNRGTFRKNIESQADLSGFESSVEIAQSGVNAANTRLKGQAEVDRLAQYQADEIIEASLAQALREQDFSQAAIDLNASAYQKQRYLGMSPDMAVRVPYTGNQQDRALEIAGEAAGMESAPESFSELAEALKANTAAMTRQAKAAEDLVIEQRKRPVAPPRAAANGANQR